MPHSSGVDFRVAEPADSLCIGVLATQVFLDTYAADGVRPDLAREVLANYSPSVFEARIRDSSNHFLLAERAGHLVAFSECSASAEPPLPSLTGGLALVRLYVQRPSQRTGIGAALLAKAEAHAISTGSPLLWLAAWSENVKARAFYLAHGYQDVGVTTYWFEGISYETCIYSKLLTGAPRG